MSLCNFGWRIIGAQESLLNRDRMLSDLKVFIYIFVICSSDFCLVYLCVKNKMTVSINPLQDRSCEKALSYWSSVYFPYRNVKHGAPGAE
jgi:hypothetical protein